MKERIYSYIDGHISVKDALLNYAWEEDITFSKRIEVQEGAEDLSELPASGWVLVSSFLPGFEGDRATLVSESLFKDGRLHGPQRRFSIRKEVATLMSETWYKEGVQHGVLRVWAPDTSALVVDMTYKDGKKQCTSFFLMKNGLLHAEQSFQDGVPHGMMKTYQEKFGTLSRSQGWHHGKRHGIDVLYHGEDGFLLFCDEWDHGTKQRVLLEDLLERSLHAQSVRPKQERT